MWSLPNEQNSKTHNQHHEDDNESGVFSDFTNICVKSNTKRPANDFDLMKDGEMTQAKKKRPNIESVSNQIRVLENANCDETAEIERLFLQRFQFREYDKERDLNRAPTVIYSRSMNKYYVHQEQLKEPTILNLRDFENTGHTLCIDNIRSYARPFSLDIDCIKCRSNGEITTRRHASECDINTISECLNDIIKFKIKFFIMSNKCGFHIYSNCNVSIFHHLYIRDALNVKIADMDTAVVEVPDLMPLPYSSKAYKDKIYKPMYDVMDRVMESFHVCLSIDNFDYHEMFVIKQVTPKNREHLVMTIVTSTTSEYLVFDKKRSVKTKIPSFLNAVSCTPELDVSFSSDAVKHVEQIIAESPTVGLEEDNLTKTYTEIQLTTKLNNLQECFSAASDHFSIYFSKFGMLCFGEDFQLFTNDGLNCDLLQRYIYHSAIQFKSLNLQHYIVSLHKCVENELSFGQILEILKLMYEQQTENYVQHIIDNYHTFTRDLYPTDFNQILKYMQLYITKTITPFMHLTEVFDIIMSNRISMTAADFNGLLRTEDSFTVKEWNHRFLKATIEICHTYQFLITYDGIVYYLETDSFIFAPLTKNLEFCLSWHVKTSDIIQKIQNEAKTFQVSRFCESNKYMTATTVGVFNSISGLYASKSPLVPFTKYRYSMLWPMRKSQGNEQLRCYEDINRDILKRRPIVKRILTQFSENIDSLFINFHFIPAIVGLQMQCWDISGVTICSFFENLKHYQDLTEALPVVELYVYDMRFVMFIIIMLNEHSIQVVTDYKKLIQSVFATNTDESSVTSARWQAMFTTTFGVEYENGMCMFKKTSKQYSYAERLLSYDYDTPDIVLTARDVIIGVCLTKALSKCKQFSMLFEAFDQISAKTSRHVNMSLLSRQCDSSYENMTKLYDELLDYIIENKKDQFEVHIANVCLHLCKSTGFLPETFHELLNMYSASIVPINIKKKIYVLFGQRDCGKSYLLDLIEFNARPSTKSILKLDENEEKTGIASTNLILRCNELSVLNIDQVKSITGDDPKSQRLYFTQKFLNGQSGQALLYAATNGVIEFKNQNRREVIDSAMVNRFHVIRLKSRFVSTTDKIDGVDSIFAMIANNKYYIENVKSSIYSPILQWVLFEHYCKTRNPLNFEPYLNNNYEDCLDYKQQVYLKNCPIYAFLTKCGFSEEDGFFISSKTLLSVVSRNFIDKAETKFVTNDIRLSKNQFFSMFKTQYCDLNDTAIIPSLQFTTLIKHIKHNMQVKEDPDKNITSTDLENHLSVYTSGIDRNNAREYFKKLTPNVQGTVSLSNIDFESGDESDAETTITDVCYNELYEKNFFLKGWTFVNEDSISYDFEGSDTTIVPVNKGSAPSTTVRMVSSKFSFRDQ